MVKIYKGNKMIKNQKKFIEYLKSTSDILSSISIIDKSKIDTYIEQWKGVKMFIIENYNMVFLVFLALILFKDTK